MNKLSSSVFLSSFLLLIGLLSSCGALMSRIYGVKQIEGVNKDKIEQFYSSIDFIGVLTEKVIIDSATFQSFRKHKNDLIQKDLSQPIQIHYFEKTELVSFHANCYAKGRLKNLDWNYQDRFESFIPKSAVQDLSGYPDYQALSERIKGVKRSTEKETIIVIFWTRMLEDISKDAIRIVLNNARKFDKEDKVHLVLINTDSFFSKL